VASAGVGPQKFDLASSSLLFYLIFVVQPTENRRGLDAETGGKLVPVDVFKETKSREPLPRGVHRSVQLAKVYYPPPTSGRITLGICFEVEPALAWS